MEVQKITINKFVGSPSGKPIYVLNLYISPDPLMCPIKINPTQNKNVYINQIDTFDRVYKKFNIASRTEPFYYILKSYPYPLHNLYWYFY